MAKAGDVLDNGHLRYLIKQSARETNGALLEMEVTYRPGSPPPPPHFHPRQDEHFRVLSGALRFVLDGRETLARAGDEVTIPARTVHAANNPHDQPATVTWSTRPALRSEEFFETLCGLAKDGKTNTGGAPGLLQVAALAREFREEWVLARPPPIVSACLFCVLSPIAHLAGLRGRYEKYSGPRTSGSR